MFSSLSTLTQALINIFVFLPYYFSVDLLVRTLFEPWKRVIPSRKRVGFSLSEYWNDVAFNLVSRSIGCVVRLATLVTYVLAQIIYVPMALILLGGYIVCILPVQLLIRSIAKSEHVRLTELQQEFISTHTKDPAHVPAVEQWFTTWHAKTTHHARWWELDNLFNTVPIGRDWAQGYTPTLDNYVVDLSGGAGQYEDKPMTIGRETELKTIEDVLCKTSGANILMVGEPGVGKRTIIESLAYRIYKGRGNPLLSFKRLLEMNLEKILAVDRDPKIRETILESLFEEADRAGNIIFVIHNFDAYMSAGEGRIDLGIPFEKFLRSNRIHIIGTTTEYAYQKYLYTKQVLKNHFTLLPVPEITPDITMQILLEHAHRFEHRYKVSLLYETLLATVEKSAFFITDIPFPEKALFVLDECCTFLKHAELPKHTSRIVTPDIVDIVLAKRTHMPTALTQGFKDKLLTIYDQLTKRVIGQQHALGELSAALQRSFLMIGKRKKPLATFLFLGPTGVGKTETAQVLAQEFFASSEAIIRFDMSEFQRIDDIARLIGNGESGEPGLLVSAIREKPYGILLLDEIEKAHRDLLNIFLTLLDEGYITDSLGKHVDCKSLVVIATSNAGAVEFYEHTQTVVGISPLHKGNDIMNFLIEKRYFTPEFLNRFDGVVAFEALSNESAFFIGRRMVDEIVQTIEHLHAVKVTVSDTSLRHMIAENFNPAYGARNLARAIQAQVENIVAQKILTNEAPKGSVLEI